MAATPVLSVRRAVLVLRATAATPDSITALAAPLRGQVVPLAAGEMALLFPVADLALRAALALLAPGRGGDAARIGIAIGTVTAVGPALRGDALEAARLLAGRAPPGAAQATAAFRDALGRELQPVAQLHETPATLPGERTDMVFELVPATAGLLARGGFLGRQALLRNAVVAALALGLVLAAVAGGWRPW